MDMEENPKEMRYCIACKNYDCESEQDPCKTCLNTDPPGREKPLWELKEKAFLTVVGDDVQTVEVSSYIEEGIYVIDIKTAPAKEKPDPTEFPIQLNLF